MVPAKGCGDSVEELQNTRAAQKEFGGMFSLPVESGEIREQRATLVPPLCIYVFKQKSELVYLKIKTWCQATAVTLAPVWPRYSSPFR